MVKLNFHFFKSSLIKNSLILFTGQTMSSVILLVVSIIMAREIGYDKFGVITLGLTYVNIMNTLFNYQSFNAIIKFGHEAIAAKDNKLLKSYLKQAFLQDLITAGLAFGVAIAVLNYIVAFLEWNELIKNTIIILSISILFNISGSIVGLMRLYGKFTYISRISIITAIVKCCLVFAGIYFDMTFYYYVFIELFSLVLQNLLNALAGVKILKRNGLLDFLFVNNKWNIGFLKFNIYNNIVSILDLPVGEFTKVYVNQFLGTSNLGLYNILVRVGNIVYTLTGPIATVVFPEFSKLIANNNIKSAFRITKKVVAISFVAGGVLILLQYLSFPLWSEYIFKGETSKFIVCFYFMYTVFCASVTSIHQIFIALNLVKYNISIILTANLIYVFITPLLMSKMELTGLIISLITQALIVVFWKVIIIVKKKKEFGIYKV